MIISETPRQELSLLLRKDSSDLSELALLPRLATGYSLFHTFQREIRRPLLQTAIFTTAWLMAGLLILKMLAPTVIITILFSGLAIIAFQLLHILYMFRCGMGLNYDDGKFQLQTFLILSAEGALTTSFVITLQRIAGAHPAFSDLIIPVFILVLTFTLLLTLGHRWYQQLKALPHPFVEAS